MCSILSADERLRALEAGAAAVTVKPSHHLIGSDPNLWMEEVLGERALAWVRDRNAHAIAAIGQLEEREHFTRMLAILDSKDKIPYFGKIGDLNQYYNFWRDESHVQGIWRRTTLESFRSDSPAWTTVLDLNALAEEDGVKWPVCMAPYTRAI